MENVLYDPAHPKPDPLSKSEYLESDLGIAAFLVVRGFPLLGLKQIARSRYGFRFDDPTGEAKAAAMAYLQGESVPAKTLFAAERDLKTLLYSQKGNVNRNGNTFKTGEVRRTIHTPTVR